MKTVFYRIECLTNLHVGSGELNYSIVDNEVEKDITGIPMIHASGIKGALKQALQESKRYGQDEIDAIFGKKGDREMGNSGTHKFLDAKMLSRPMRVFGSLTTPCVSVTTVDCVNRFLKQLDAFGAGRKDVQKVDLPAFNQVNFLANTKEEIEVEGEPTGCLSGNTLTQLSALQDVLFTAPFAVAKTFEDYDLPVMARNCLEEKNRNLWYEEVVPHGSVFYFAIVYPERVQELVFPNIVQIGGNASIGCGFTHIMKIAESAEE